MIIEGHFLSTHKIQIFKSITNEDRIYMVDTSRDRVGTGPAGAEMPILTLFNLVITDGQMGGQIDT